MARKVSENTIEMNRRKDERRELKKRVSELNAKLYKKKMINKALFTDIQNKCYSWSKTKDETLKEIKKKLKNIKNNWDDINTQITKTKFSNLKIKEDPRESMRYTVYCKYEITEERVNGKTGKVERRTYQKDETNFVIGFSNIEKFIKKRMNGLYNLEYVVKVVLLRPVANGIDLDKYKGMKIEKQRAFNMVFQYHGFNLDVNDEVPNECVPNALFKKYGNRAAGHTKFISEIADGGLDFVIKKLYWSNPLDYGIDVPRGEGYTSKDILDFCNEYKIRCFGFDFKMEMFITNKDSNIKFNHNLPAFVFYFNDAHIYLIEDKEFRHALLNTSNKADLISLIANQQKKKTKKRSIEIDLPYDQWKEVSDTDIYITEPRLVHDTFYKLITQGHIYNSKIKMNDKEGVVRFGYDNKNTIIFNPDIIDVLDTIEVLNNKELTYEFKNQRIHSLAKEVLDKEFGGIPLSSMCTEGDKIFQSIFMSNNAFNGWLSEPQSTNLGSYDYNKHYTSCLNGDSLMFGWPIYSVFDEPCAFDGNIEAGFYYVETQNYLPFQGNGWYDADLVYYGKKESIITDANILYQYKPTKVLKPKYFKKFIEYVYANFKSPKLAINGMIGLFGHDYVSANKHYFTSNPSIAMNELVKSDCLVKYVTHQDYVNDGFRCEDSDKLTSNDILDTTDDVPTCFHLYDIKKIKCSQNSLPIFRKVYNTSAIKLHQMTKLVGGTVRGIFTDTIIFENPINKPHCDASIIGGIRESELKEFTHVSIGNSRKESYYLADKKQLEHITKYDVKKGKGVFITGDAGTGKSTLIKKILSELDPNTFRVCTPTHKSALVVNGQTIYNLFNINSHDHTYLKSTVEKLVEGGLKVVSVDEVSMIHPEVYPVLQDIKKKFGITFIFSGDFNQLDPICDHKYDIMKSSVFAELCDYQIMELTENWRAKNDPSFASFITDLNNIKKGKPIDYKAYGDKPQRKSICWTNKTRKGVNEEWMLKESVDKEFVYIGYNRVFEGLPVIANKTTTLEGQEVKNNEEFDVTYVDKEIVELTNSRMVIKISHSEFKFFDLAYCITIYKSQGSTYDFPYTIYEYDLLDKKNKYTAFSRSTKRENIHLVKSSYKLNKGYIYKIISPNNKVYIGSTDNHKARKRQHWEAKDKIPLHVAMMKDNYEGWTFEVIKTVEYYDKEQLLVVESIEIQNHDSINKGFNVKIPIDVTNLF